jgi:hypothetical protein
MRFRFEIMRLVAVLLGIGLVVGIIFWLFTDGLMLDIVMRGYFIRVISHGHILLVECASGCPYPQSVFLSRIPNGYTEIPVPRIGYINNRIWNTEGLVDIYNYIPTARLIGGPSSIDSLFRLDYVTIICGLFVCECLMIIATLRTRRIKVARFEVVVSRSART